MDTIENKVAKSGLITLDLEEMKPRWDIAEIDISHVLIEGLMLREKDFRAFVSSHDWTQYQKKYVFIHCSTDAIVPTWAYMLIGTKLSGVAEEYSFGSRDDLVKSMWLAFIDDLDYDQYKDHRVIVKGCSNEKIDESVYLKLAGRLTPIVKSLMFGEPCSTVPLYKKQQN